MPLSSWFSIPYTPADAGVTDSEMVAFLAAIATVDYGPDEVIYTTALNEFDSTAFTPFARTLVDDSDAIKARITLGVVIGTQVQAYDSDLDLISALSTTSYGRSFLTAADIAAARLILGQTYYVVSSDVTNSTTSAVNITGLTFTPVTNKRYRITAMLLGRADAVTTGVRPGIATLPTGLTDFTSRWESTGTSATTVSDQLMNTGTVPGAGIAGATPDITTSWFYKLEGTLIAGATPSGTFQLTITSEVAASVVTVKAGSWMVVEEY